MRNGNAVSRRNSAWLLAVGATAIVLGLGAIATGLPGSDGVWAQILPVAVGSRLTAVAPAESLSVPVACDCGNAPQRPAVWSSHSAPFPSALQMMETVPAKRPHDGPAIDRSADPVAVTDPRVFLAKMADLARRRGPPEAPNAHSRGLAEVAIVDPYQASLHPAVFLAGNERP